MSYRKQPGLMSRGLTELNELPETTTGYIFNNAQTKAIATSEPARKTRRNIVIVAWVELIVAVLLYIIILTIFDRVVAIYAIPFGAMIFVQVALGMAVWADHHRPTIILIAGINVMTIVTGFFAVVLQIIEIARCLSNNRTQGSCYQEVTVTLSTGVTTIQCVGICPSNVSLGFQLTFIVALIVLSAFQIGFTATLLRDNKQIVAAEEYLEKAAKQGNKKETLEAAKRLLNLEREYGFEGDSREALSVITAGGDIEEPGSISNPIGYQKYRQYRASHHKEPSVWHDNIEHYQTHRRHRTPHTTSHNTTTTDIFEGSRKEFS